MKNKTARHFQTVIFLLFCLSPAWSEAAGPKTEAFWPEPGRIEPALFQPTAEEGRGLAKVFAAPGQPDGFWGGEGAVVYRGQAERPLEMYWPRPARTGAENALAEGYGELSLRYAEDHRVLERYRGEFRNGFREGRGELLGRDAYGDSAFLYKGEFRQGRMEGRGLYFCTDFQERGEAPFVYEGEFKNDTFHGQGVMRELATGRVIHEGLWHEGFPFKKGAAQWAKANRRSSAQ